MTRTVALALAAAAFLLTACGGGDESTTAPAPVKKAQVCFRAKALQTLGGEALAAADDLSKDARSSGATQRYLNRVARRAAGGAFAPSLRGDLRRVAQAGTEESAAIVAAANKGLVEVEADPELLLDEPALDAAFADARRLAEESGFSDPGCRY